MKTPTSHVLLTLQQGHGHKQYDRLVFTGGNKPEHYRVLHEQSETELIVRPWKWHDTLIYFLWRQWPFKRSSK